MCCCKTLKFLHGVCSRFQSSKRYTKLFSFLIKVQAINAAYRLLVSFILRKRIFKKILRWWSMRFFIPTYCVFDPLKSTSYPKSRNLLIKNSCAFLCVCVCVKLRAHVANGWLLARQTIYP